MAAREISVPLTPFQEEVLRLLARNRSPESYLAGGAALHSAPNSIRYSQDLDFFHDSERRVAEAFESDRSLHDTAWRFMPAVRDPGGWFRLHDVDLAINKLLALAGRDEPRDYVDILDAHDRILPLGAMVWAATGKDPGLSPHGILELLKRRGRPRQEDLDRLRLATPLDASRCKERWLRALEEAEAFVSRRPAAELGCLHFHAASGEFRAPSAAMSLEEQGLLPHFGAPGGVLPLAVEE